MISKHVVDFHLKNAIQKLQSSNKTAAVARAAALGLLN
jgi:LuxR family transcriptional regulator